MDRFPSFTSNDVVIVLAALGLFVPIIGAVIVNIIVALRTGAKMDQNLHKLEELKGQVAEVHAITNSNLSAMTARFEIASNKTNSLQEIVTDLKSERDKLSRPTDHV